MGIKPACGKSFAVSIVKLKVAENVDVFGIDTDTVIKVGNVCREHDAMGPCSNYDAQRVVKEIGAAVDLSVGGDAVDRRLGVVTDASL